MAPSSSLPIIIPQLIVGLGNPGAQYERTRHNIGFALIDRLALAWQIKLTTERRFQGDYGEGFSPQGQKIRLLKPTTYMNQSGQSLRGVVDWFKLSPESVLVVFDELALPMGKLRLRLRGSAGGHNGMRSIIAHLGTAEVPRLRIGIGSLPNPGTETELSSSDIPPTSISGNRVSFVLGRFTPSESQLLPKVLGLSVDALEMALKQGVEQAMNRYNSQSVA
ncbi:MAG: aminoacyl-tRNA hydrolase [Acaryochloridaceae cyanobacterium SU_2_1]|nr:aminoacyl-tRNA hydrolase [Acaryochloridaceae cyanobacterium SU_2_1]